MRRKRLRRGMYNLATAAPVTDIILNASDIVRLHFGQHMRQGPSKQNTVLHTVT
jgi:hypothetical protein